MSEVAEFDPVVTRKLQPEAQHFECVVCERTILVDRWMPKQTEAPICFGCTCQFGSRMSNRSGITRADTRLLQRLSALSSALEWQVKNG